MGKGFPDGTKKLCGSRRSDRLRYQRCEQKVVRISGAIGVQEEPGDPKEKKLRCWSRGKGTAGPGWVLYPASTLTGLESARGQWDVLKMVASRKRKTGKVRWNWRNPGEK